MSEEEKGLSVVRDEEEVRLKALADEIRSRLSELGVTLEDRPDGTRWRIEPRRGG